MNIMSYNFEYHTFLLARLNALNWEELERGFFMDQRSHLVQQVALLDNKLLVLTSNIEGLKKVVISFFCKVLYLSLL